MSVEYWKGLWIGGGLSWEALTIVGVAVRGAAKVVLDGPIRVELENLANAVAAELEKRPAALALDPNEDLI